MKRTTSKKESDFLFRFFPHSKNSSRSYLIQYQEALRKELDDKNRLIHDFRKHLNTLSFYAHEEDIQSVQAYLLQLLEHPALQKRATFCDHHLLNGILNHYSDICAEHQILLETDIRKRALFFLTDMDLTELFCNILENAVDASAQAEEKWIRLHIIKENHETTIHMRNTFPPEVLSDHSKKTSRWHSRHKAVRQGYGMQIVEQITIG